MPAACAHLYESKNNKYNGRKVDARIVAMVTHMIININNDTGANIDYSKTTYATVIRKIEHNNINASMQH